MAVEFVIVQLTLRSNSICMHVIPETVSATRSHPKMAPSRTVVSLDIRGACSDVMPHTEVGTLVRLLRISTVMGMGEVKAICIHEGGMVGRDVKK